MGRKKVKKNFRTKSAPFYLYRPKMGLTQNSRFEQNVANNLGSLGPHEVARENSAQNDASCGQKWPPKFENRPKMADFGRFLKNPTKWSGRMVMGSRMVGSRKKFFQRTLGRKWPKLCFSKVRVVKRAVRARPVADWAEFFNSTPR